MSKKNISKKERKERIEALNKCVGEYDNFMIEKKSKKKSKKKGKNKNKKNDDIVHVLRHMESNIICILHDIDAKMDSMYNTEIRINSNIVEMKRDIKNLQEQINTINTPKKRQTKKTEEKHISGDLSN